jgi:hypothetical protein
VRTSIAFSVGKTDEQGRYTIPDLPECTATMILLGDEASMRTRQPLVQPAQLVAGAVATANFEQPATGSRLHGRVLDSAGHAVGKVGVSLGPSDAVDAEHWLATSTADDGSYSFSGLPAGPHDVYVGDPGAVSVTFVTRTTLPAEGELELDLHMAAGRIEGTVRAAGGEPLPPVVLLLEGDIPGAKDASAFGFVGKVTTLPDGSFAFENVADGRYRATAIAVRRNWGAERRDGIVVTHGVADGPVDFVLSPGGTISVSVRRATGEPAAGARLDFKDADGISSTFGGTQLTDAEGRFRVEGVKPGRWYVSAALAGGKPVELAVEVQPGAEQPVELVLAPAQ